MSEKQDQKCCPEKVQLLIENEATTFDEADRKWLESLTEDQIDKVSIMMAPKEPTDNQDNQDTQVQDAKTPTDEIKQAVADGIKDSGIPIKDIIKNQQDQDDQNDGAQPTTLEEYVQNAPEEHRPILNQAVEMHNTKKANLVKALVANKNNTFTEEELQAKDLADLEKLAQLAQVQNYEGGGGAPKTPEDKEEGLALPVMSWDK